jgi:hypothetical protein
MLFLMSYDAKELLRTSSKDYQQMAEYLSAIIGSQITEKRNTYKIKPV